MSRQYNDGRCSCWKRVDKLLGERDGAKLSITFTLTGHHYLQVKTEKISKSRKAPKLILASYCPFCGEKLKEPKPCRT